jgi:hypothetical protein
MTILQMLRADRSLNAWLGWIAPLAIVFLLGIIVTGGGLGMYGSHRYRLRYEEGKVLTAITYGNVIDVDIDNTRTAQPCEGAYVDRRLVQYYPGTNRVMVAMPIRERGIANPEIGRRRFHLIMGIPAPLRDGAVWNYQSHQHDNCGFWQSIFEDDGSWLGDAVAVLQGGHDMVAPDARVLVATSAPNIPGVAFTAPSTATILSP